MASQRSARAERNMKIGRIVAIVICAALLLSAVLPFLAR